MILYVNILFLLQNWAFVARFCFLSEEGRFQYTIKYDRVSRIINSHKTAILTKWLFYRKYIAGLCSSKLAALL